MITTVDAVVASYEEFLGCSSWRVGTDDVLFDLVDSAVRSLQEALVDAEPVDIELANRQSLLLAALHTGAIEGLHRMNRGVTLTALDNALDGEDIVDDAEGTEARRQVEAALGSFDYAVDAARTTRLRSAVKRKPANEGCTRSIPITCFCVTVPSPTTRRPMRFVRRCSASSLSLEAKSF